MGIFDSIKKGTGLDYLETDKPKTTSPQKQEKKPAVKQDRQLRVIETKIQKIIEDLQEIQEKLRVRRGI